MGEDFEKLILVEGNRCKKCGFSYPNYTLDCSYFHEEITEKKLPEAEIIKEEGKLKEKEIILSKEIESILGRINFEIKKIVAGYHNIEKLDDSSGENKERLIKNVREIINEEMKACRNCDWNEMMNILKDYGDNFVGLMKEVYNEAINNEYAM